MTIIDPDQDPRRPSHHEIREMAYRLWERRGRPLFVESITLQDWFDAEDWLVYRNTHRASPIGMVGGIHKP